MDRFSWTMAKQGRNGSCGSAFSGAWEPPLVKYLVTLVKRTVSPRCLLPLSVRSHSHKAMVDLCKEADM